MRNKGREMISLYGKNIISFSHEQERIILEIQNKWKWIESIGIVLFRYSFLPLLKLQYKIFMIKLFPFFFHTFQTSIVFSGRLFIWEFQIHKFFILQINHWIKLYLFICCSHDLILHLQNLCFPLKSTAYISQ
jgi:hypothetical protein